MGIQKNMESAQTTHTHTTNTRACTHIHTQTSRQNWGEKKEEAASRSDRKNVLMTEDTGSEQSVHFTSAN